MCGGGWGDQVGGGERPMALIRMPFMKINKLNAM